MKAHRPKPILYFFCLALFLAFAGAPSLGATVLPDYYSLHLQPAEIMYRDSEGAYQFETRAGFRYLHDYTDPKVLCSSELGPCDTTEKQTAIRVLEQYYQRFRVYVPPGTTYLQIMIYMPKLAQIATVSRFEQPPTGDYSGMGYNDFPIDDDAGATLEQLQSADYLTRNSGGHTTVANQYFPDVPAGGGWLYVRVISFDTLEPLESRYTFKVNVPQFQTWFSAMTDTDWINFGEIGGYIIGCAPAVPADINCPATDDDGSFSVSWSPVDDATSYELQRSTSASFSEALTVCSEPSTSFEQTDLENGTYYYRVRASKDGCNSNSDWRNAAPVVVGTTASVLGKLTFVSDRAGKNDIWTMDLSAGWITGTPVNLTAAQAGDCGGPKWSPKGNRIVFDSTSSGSSQIWVMNVDGSQKTQLTFMDGYEAQAPSWSPDGQRIAFHRHPGSSACDAESANEVCTMRADGTGVACFGNTDDRGEYAPSWSPDGLKLIYVRDEGDCDSPSDIWTMNADGSAKALLHPVPGNDGGYQTSPIWGSQGQMLFSEMLADGDHWELGVVELYGTDHHTLSHPGAEELQACSWALEDSMIIYQAQTDGLTRQLWLVDGDGTQSIPLTNGPGSNQNADFIDIAKTLLICSTEGNFDLDEHKEFAVAATLPDGTVQVTFHDDDGSIMGQATTDAVREISLASGNFDDDPEQEVVLACVQADGNLAAIIFEASGVRKSTGVGGQCSNLTVACGQFDTDAYDEYVVSLRQFDGTLAAVSFNHDGSRIGKGVGGLCSNVSIATGNFDSNPSDDEYVVSLLQADGTLGAITYQGNGTRIGKGVGGLCANVSVAAGNFRPENDPQDEYVVSLLQANGTLAAISFYGDGARIGKGVGGVCSNVSVSTGRFWATAPLNGYVVALNQADQTPAAIFFTADGTRLGKGAGTEKALLSTITCGDIDASGNDEAVLNYLTGSGQIYWAVFAENGEELLSGP